MENEFKGTKGKWIWIHSHGNTLSRLESDNGQEICNFGNDYDYYPTEGVEPNVYDAQLISKAPEMLEMLKKLSGAVKDSMMEISVDSEMFGYLKDIDKANDNLIKEATTI